MDSRKLSQIGRQRYHPRVVVRAVFYMMFVVEALRVNFGESHVSLTAKFSKNLPRLPHLPQSKLSEKWLSFDICGSLVHLNLPRICRTCRICPHRDRSRDERDVRSELFLALATV